MLHVSCCTFVLLLLLNTLPSGPKSLHALLNEFGIDLPKYYTYTYTLELSLNKFKSVMSLLLQFTITLLQVPIALTLLNCFGMNYEMNCTYTYTLDCFWITSVIISARRVACQNDFRISFAILPETVTSEKKSRDLGFWFSLGWITKAKAKENLCDFAFFRQVWPVVGACVWPTSSLRKQMRKKWISGGIYFPFPLRKQKREKSPDFHL